MNSSPKTLFHRCACGVRLASVFVAALSLSCAHRTAAGNLERVEYEDDLVQVASFELHCRSSELSVTRLGDRSAGVTGCGTRMTYVRVGESIGGTGFNNGSWVASSRSRDGYSDEPQ